MQINKILLTGILCANFLYAQAQKKNNSSIKGHLFNHQSSQIHAATIRLLPLNKVVITDEKGNFQFNDLPAGTYTLQISALGHTKKEQKVILKEGQSLDQDFAVNEDARQIDEVSILGVTKNKLVNKEAYNVLSIDAKSLHNTTMDLGQVMNRVSGARVRESGGVGSDMRFSLNGFSGSQIKFFVDGVPMDNFGSSFQLNNIPVNFADRIEVYKGVVPVWLGGDALGGAVNIVTNTSPRTYVDASYAYGSFNTHKSSINAGYTAKSGFTVQMNAFQNYSDNNYWVDVDVVEPETGLNNPARVRRFHDRYHNETVIINAGVTGKTYADQLMIGGTFGQNRADIQTGNRMYDVYGARYRTGNILQPNIKYAKKDLFVKGLDLRMNGNFNFGEERSVDTAYKRYNWDGTFVYKDPKNPGRLGGESSLSDYRFKNNNGLASAGLSYKLNDKHSFSLNEQYSTFNRKGTNRLDPDNIFDKQPKITRKNILGLGYRFDLNSKFNATAFLKQYNQHVVSYNAIQTYDRALEKYVYDITVNKVDFSKAGYGFAATYFLFKDLQLKGSYEKAYRLPDNEELFGNAVTVTGNMGLKPESSDNINLGATYNFNIQDAHAFEIQGNFIFRNANDYIRSQLLPGGTNGEYIQRSINEAKVSNRGIDAEIHYAYKRRLSLNANFTYQNLTNQTEFESLPGGGRSPVVSPVYKDRIPNTPYSFGNANATLYFDNVLQKGNRLSIGYNLLYVNQFYLFWPSQGSKEGKLNIPTQWAHDASVVYNMAGGKYNIAMECLNLTDSKLYDNFMLQKPSRSFNVKLRYFISKAISQ